MKKQILIASFVLLFAVVGIQSVGAQMAAGSYVKVLSPNGGETLEVGKTYRITWQASSNIDRVYLMYKKDNYTGNWICFDCANTGYFDWTVNVGNTNTTNTQYKIEIIGYENSKGSILDQSDNFFTVPLPQQSIPSITLFSAKDPNLDNRSVTIVWNASSVTDASLDVNCTPGSISFTTDKGNYPSCEKGGVWSWSGQTSGSVVITPSGNTNPITIPFTLTLMKNGYPTSQTQKISVTFPASTQTQVPYVKVISPNGGEVFTSGSSITIRWTSSGAPANSIASISLTRDEGGGNVSGTPLTGSWFNNDDINLPLSTGSFTTNLPTNIQPGNYKIRVECIDGASGQYFCGQNVNLSVQDYSDGFITISSPSTSYTPLIESIVLKDDSLGLPNLSFYMQWKTRVPAIVKATITCSPAVSLYTKEGNITQPCSSTNPVVINYAGPQDNNAANFGQANTNYPVNVTLTIQASYLKGDPLVVSETKTTSFTYTPPVGDGKFYFISAPSSGSSLKIGSKYAIKTTPPANNGVVTFYLTDGNKKGGERVGLLLCDQKAEIENYYCNWSVGNYVDVNSVVQTVSPGSNYSIEADLNTTSIMVDANSGPFNIVSAGTQPNTNPDIATLLKLIEELKKQIATLQGQVVTDNSLPNETTSFSYNWQNPLYVGMKNNEDVKALQNALLLEKVYTGPVTGNFGPLTLAATRAFQEKYGITPVTGFVGELTRSKLNSLY
jgi:hypothetical protein